MRAAAAPLDPRRAARRTWASAVVALLLGAADAPAQVVPIGGELPVNTVVAGDQRYASVAIGPSAFSFLVWFSVTGVGDEDVRGRQFTTDGQPVDDDFLVNTTTPGHQTLADVTSAGDGGFIVAWDGGGDQDGDGTGIIAQRFDVDGVPLAGEFIVNSQTDGPQSYPSVAAGADGAFLVAWETVRDDGDIDIVARRFDSLGASLGNDFPVNMHTDGWQRRPRIAARPGGGYVVVWRSQGEDGDGWGVYAQRYDASGGRDGTPFRVNTITAGDQDLPAVAIASDGVMAVTWQTPWPNAAQQAVVRWFDAAGVALGDEVLLASLAGIKSQPRVAAVDRGFLFTWGQDLDIFARQFAGANQPVGDAFPVNTTTGTNQFDPNVAASANTAMIIWGSGNDQDGDGNGIFAQRFAILSTRTPTPSPSPSDTPTAEPTATMTAPPPSSPTATATAATPTSACAGDCDGTGTVTIDELVRAVSIALAVAPLADCPAADRFGDGEVTIDDLVAAVTAALDGC